MKLFPKLLLLALLPVLVTCALLFAIWQSLNSRSLRDQAEKLARAELDSEVNGAMSVFQQVDRSLAAVGRTPNFKSTSDVARARALADLRSFMLGRIEALQYHSLDGSVYGADGSKIPGERSLVDEVRSNNGRTHVGPAELNPATGSTVVKAVVPLRTEAKEITGALCALVKVSDIYEQILSIRQGKSGRAILVGPLGRIGSLLIQPDLQAVTAALVSPNGAPTNGLPAELSKVIKSAKEGRHEFVLNGRRHTLFFRTFPETEWRVAMAYRDDDIFAAKNQMERFGLMIFAGCIVLSLAATHSVWHYIVKPLKEVERAHREFAAGNLATRAAVTTDDEVAALGESFNRMADTFEGSTKAAAAELEARRRAETALVEHESLLRDIIDKTPAILFIKDLEGRYIMVNARFEALAGAPFSEICGLTDYDLFPKAQADVFRANDRHVAESGSNLECDETVVDQGRTLSVLSLKFPLRNHDGKIYAVGGISTEIDERVKAQRALKESEARFRALVEFSPDAIVVYDFDSRHFIDANPAAERLFETTRDELLKLTPAVLSPERQPNGRLSSVMVAEVCAKVFDEGHASFDWVHLTTKGREIMCHVRLARHPADGRKLIRSSILDVTEQRRAEALEQEASDRVLRQNEILAAVAASDAVAAGRVEEVARHLTEAVSQELKIARVGVWLFSEDETRLRCVNRFVLETQSHAFGDELTAEQFRNEFEHLKKAKHVAADDACTDPRTAGYAETYLKPMGITAMLDAVIRVAGKPLGTVCLEHVKRPHQWQTDEVAFACQLADQIGMTIANEARHRAVDALRESEERYRLLVEGARDAIVTVTPEGAISSTNAVTQTLTGWPRGFWNGKPFEPLVHPDDMAVARGLLASCLSGVKPPPTELRVRRVDGTYVSMELVPTPLFRDSKLISILVVARDISDRKKAREAQARLETQLRQAQKMEAIGTLAGGIAHDFNNILGAIMGNIDLARMDIAPGHPAAESLDEVAKASKRASSLVRQILTFSRKQEQAFLPVALSDVISEASSLLRATIPASIEIRTTLAENEPLVLADSTQLHQVLMNLGTNAAHAMRGKGGLLEITEQVVEVDPASATAVNGLRPGRYLRLTVADSGVGMDRATLERIFEPFFTTKAQGEGTGLGLSVVHGIVRNHGGVITVESDPGKGTRFHVLLPVTVKQAGAVDEEQTVPPDGNGREILVVDDEPPLVSTIERTLHRRGFKVTSFSDPQAALEMFQESPARFSAVITDQTMPHLSGIEMTNRLRALRSGVPVIVMTGNDATEAARSFEGIPGILTLAKPVDVAALDAAVNAILVSA